MRRLLAVTLLIGLLLGMAPTPVHAGGTTAAVALGLASFAVFNQIVGAAYYRPWPAYGYGGPWAYPYASPYPYAYPYSYSYVVSPPQVVYTAPQVVYQQPQVATPLPAIQRTVEFPHGRYELRGDGVTVAYQWIWIPKVPPVPPPPSP
jgi:hypothetical protein